MRHRLGAPAAFLAHLMYTPPSLQKALAQEAQTRDRRRANKKLVFNYGQSKQGDSRTGLSMRS
jgi:hypothetical protein